MREKHVLLQKCVVDVLLHCETSLIVSMIPLQKKVLITKGTQFLHESARKIELKMLFGHKHFLLMLVISLR